MFSKPSEAGLPILGQCKLFHILSYDIIYDGDGYTILQSFEFP